MASIKNKITVIKETGSELEQAIREKTVGYIVAGFSVVAGLAWNDAIKAFIDRFFPDPGNGLKAKFLYAAIITSVVVLISVYLMKLFNVEKSDKSSKKDEKVAVDDKKEGGKTKTK